MRCGSSLICRVPIWLSAELLIPVTSFFSQETRMPSSKDHSQVFDPVTQRMATRAYTEYHCFAPISPHLVIVLRSNLLPQGLQDIDEDSCKKLLEYTKSLHNDPASAGSTLQDLPVEKCRNSYSIVQDGVVVPTAHVSLPPSQHDFYFQFFSIPATVFPIVDC